jgi:hypothetical protein
MVRSPVETKFISGACRYPRSFGWAIRTPGEKGLRSPIRRQVNLPHSAIA